MSYEHVERVEDVVQVAAKVQARIIKLIPEEQKIGLSLKGVSEESVSEVPSDTVLKPTTEFIEMTMKFMMIVITFMMIPITFMMVLITFMMCLIIFMMILIIFIKISISM